MPRRKAEPKAVETGRRVGTKKSDRRWQDNAGNIWASKLESDLFQFFQAAGAAVRKCDERDSVPYVTRIRQGRCGACGSDVVRQEHTYTPDLCVDATPAISEKGGNLIEAKGYLRPDDRRILRGVLQARPDINLHLILQRYHKPTVDWARKFLKIPVLIFGKQGLEKAQ